ncbi:gliding motility-associated-like protein [Catalinimonas alkaloidigena]|uniref:T9SS type B sorting domain-containing protein n=1 Tax=Catalinimonas alkaloidigena TaxID=1075417 RepID=UPI002405663B|nr:gliding motility-associated C-terminal domain-containing protein [Catalinimonas alkaloidigena]MDF9795851.1 gliding motility-associated-like protein [Catalinimonas alkaloidigena]
MRICKLLSLILCCCSLAFTAYGQTLSTKERFEVNVTQGCAPLTVTASNLFTAIPDVPIVWNFDWDGDEGNITVDPDASPQSASFEYTEPGTYKLLQVIGNINDPIDTIIIEVMEPREPRYKVYNCINNTVFIDFSEEDYYDQLFFDFGDGGIQTVSTDQESISYQYYDQGEYTIAAEGLFDDAAPNCGLADTTINTVENLDIATLSRVQVENEQEIQLAFELADNDVSYRLEVAENGSSDFSFASLDLDGKATTFIWNDPDVNARDTYYCFRIVAVNRCDESLNQFSNMVCSIALQATAEDLQNQLEWQSDGFDQYQVIRDGNQIDEINATLYTDTEVTCQEDYTYSIVAEQNGAVSISLGEDITAISTTVPPAPDNLDASLAGTGADLQWPAENEAVQYYIYRAEDGGSSQLYDSLLQSTSVNLRYTDPQELTVDIEYCYQITYVNDCGNESERSEEVCVTLPRQARVFFPNAFTPNGDGLNDIFVYKAELLETVQFQVYNRWGELLFSTTDIGEGWDGTYKGGLAPQGTYMYVLQVVDQLGNAFSRSGNFTLLNAAP